MRLPISRIAGFVSDTGEFEQNAMGGTFDPRALATGYSIDSRTIKPGELFFAVKGERMDGHDFVEQAFLKGAVAAIVRKDSLQRYPEKTRLIGVNDTLAALQTLAAAVRRLWARPVVAITGSAGKTTTKDAIAHVLETRFHVLKSEGNLNNHFGLPLMLLRLEPEHDIAVVELGMSHAGEIAALAAIAQPEIGVVTNVAPVHLEFFNSVDEIANAKYELIQALPGSGTAVLNADDRYVSKFGGKWEGNNFRGKVVTYAIDAAADVKAENIESCGTSGSVFEVVARGGRENVSLPLMGRHNILNALAAVAVGLERGLTLSEAIRALVNLAPSEKRGQVIQVGNVTVINDCYNSNPKALDAMVDALVGTTGKRRIVVAGEMLELGPQAVEMHRRAGQSMAAKKIDFLIGVRGMAEQMVEAGRQSGMATEFVATPEEAGEWLARQTRDGDVVLLKASRGVQLERALTTWKSRATSTPKPQN